jgi:V/A-type H+-transporting ATPase subunit I
VHLTIARIKHIFSVRTLRLLSDVGTIAILWGMYNVILVLVVSNEYRSFPLLPVSMYLIAGGFVLNFLFNSYEGNLAKAVLSSCGNIISMVLGITNSFADIMSYIRLWAVGLAGASIAATINGMAGPSLGTFLVFAAVVLLIAGHGLNVILNVLGVLVHGVRLNTLEFSQHAGVAWTGTKYKPFA